jgi:hypothetical protein
VNGVSTGLISKNENIAFIFIYQERRWMIMNKNGINVLIILVFTSILCAGTVNAAINTIGQGNAVFVGEEGLDVSAALGPDTQIGWWASAADITTTSPTKTIDLKGRITSFMIGPSEFDGYSGNWYRLNSAGKSDGIAFNVVDPQLEIKAEDTTVAVDPTITWIPSGDDIRFKIDTNLVQMASQRASPPLITIKVQGPDGGSYTSLYNAGGSPTSIVDIPVATRPFYTASIWNMGNRDRYPPGTYTYWAECNVNKMNDNYGETGKTVSRKIPLLNQGVNPLITKPTTVQTTKTLQPATTRLTVVQSTPAGTSTTMSPPSLTASPTTTSPEIPTPVPTKSPGFGVTLAIFAILFGLAVYCKKQ